MKYIKVLVLALLLSSCYSEGSNVPLPTVEDIQLVLLFEHDGCKIYRFRDGNVRMVYWSDCRGDISYETGGKHKTRVQTLSN